MSLESHGGICLLLSWNAPIVSKHNVVTHLPNMYLSSSLNFRTHSSIIMRILVGMEGIACSSIVKSDRDNIVLRARSSSRKETVEHLFSR